MKRKDNIALAYIYLMSFPVLVPTKARPRSNAIGDLGLLCLDREEVAKTPMEMETMTFISVNPLTGLPKEYANSGEWMQDVDAATAKPVEEPREVKTFADASRRLREEVGIDLRSDGERQAVDNAEFIERKVAEGIAAALAKQAQPANQTPKPTTQAHSASGPRYKFYDGQTGCGCNAHKPAGQTVIHSGRGTGPVMSAQLVTRPEVVRHGTAHQLFRIRAPPQ